MGQRVVRLKWLVRRIGRMYWQEVPYRVASVCRSALQGAGVFTAARVPALLADHRFGAPWCATGAAVMPEASVLARADTVMGGDWSVYGTPVRFEQGLPDWNADPVTGTRIPLDFGLSIDFRHVGDGIDIKHLWELNRVLWWVPLAQAWAASGDKRYLDRLGQLLASWLQACPYARGANWSSPVEHAIRLINWSLVWHLIGGAASPLFEGEPGRALLVRWLDSIYQHMRFASDNYSFYSSADNHLIGEAAGVFVAAHTWDCWAEGRRLREGARRILEEEAIKQFGADGVNLEQAFCYHKFSLQFLLAAGLCGKANGDALSAALWARIESACVFMAALTDVAGKVPKYGDADDGDVWRLASGPQDSHLELLAIGARQFDHGALLAKCKTLGEAVLAMASATLGAADLSLTVLPANAALAELPRQFPIGGYALLGNRLHQPDELRVLVDCGALGYNRIAGHGHADALSVLVSVAGEALLVDAGTYCYNAAPALRHFFRGTSAHNTLQVDGQDQSIYGASFLWLRDVQTVIEALDNTHGGILHAQHDGYLRLPDPTRHHRRVTVADDDSVLIEDWLVCSGSHQVNLLWHCAVGVTATSADGAGAWRIDGKKQSLMISFEGATTNARVIQGQDNPVQGWVSPSFYVKHSAPVLSVQLELKPIQVLRTRLQPMLRHTAAIETAP